MKTCRAITPPNTDACGKPAKRLVTFRDGDKAPMCPNCAMHYEELFKDLGAPVKVEPLDVQ